MSRDALLRRPLYVYDLPPEILQTLEFKSRAKDTPAHLDQPHENDAATSSRHSSEDAPIVATACALCKLSFASLKEQREHARSDLHGYNLKLKLKGLRPVDDVEFEKIVGDLDESISGSDSESDSDSNSNDDRNEGNNDNLLNALLKKQATVTDPVTAAFTSRKRKRDAGKPPLLWFRSSALPSDTSLGVYRALFTQAEQEEELFIVDSIRQKQLSAPTGAKGADEDGGVPLPGSLRSPHVFLCMIGGGHFAAMIVSLAPKMGKKQGVDERQASVLAHKTFHRYTTRRKQGGAQSANDSAKGTAHSAGSSLRRYNETALVNDVRGLLNEWKDLIDSSQLIFVRATGSTNRRTLFGPYDAQVLKLDDTRNRGFPFSTRRATQSELMRCFVELTRAKISQVDEAALAAAVEAEAAADTEKKAAATSKSVTASKSVTLARNPEEEAKLLHTSQIEALVRRSKAPALLSYLTSNSLSPDFTLYPTDSPAHHHAPTPLHLASSSNSPALIQALLVKAGADPTVTSSDGKTAFEVAGDRGTRDAFRLARSELGESKWAWDAGARIPSALSKADVDSRTAQERQEVESAEAVRRKAEMDRLREEDSKKEEQRQSNVDSRREKKMGKGKLIGQQKTAEERREEEGRGMTEEMRRRLERERRARAAEERMKRLATG